ncbi:Csn9p NDAI_0A01140 [Naumovozyma dairenensis CBS 421]|uniref:PCI domain-containing protein n=1 Tax=Naumovozyma dairenensis (strain ATCC 10597 / BCRC 20456 / CBS 421 / NBRC 0211 / NRRL Y-12639) TaxID=1071378 RepID=G0W384_NAUDC|nr:hypothetical protein NDAI_0A01140 [Naumovozyma dairenensis CBS 421]CCD22272.1 hypothetical protein NDAI_0A01140 [Naumovozyma dairenensis CBS 421]
MNAGLKEALEDPQKYHYKQEWLSSDFESTRELLEIFAFGTVNDLTNLKFSKREDLTSSMIDKLRKLTIISLSAKYRYISYDFIRKECEMDSSNDIEEYLIQLQDFFQMEIDSVGQQVRIIRCFDSRDVYANELPLINLGKDTPTTTKDELLQSLHKWKLKLLCQITDEP